MPERVLREEVASECGFEFLRLREGDARRGAAQDPRTPLLELDCIALTTTAVGVLTHCHAASASSKLNRTMRPIRRAGILPEATSLHKVRVKCPTDPRAALP